MIYNKRFFIILSLFLPNICFGDVDVSAISSAENISAAVTAYEQTTNALINGATGVPETDISTAKKTQTSAINAAKAHYNSKATVPTTSSTTEDTRTAQQKAADLQKLEDDYNEKKANEQSTANKTLTALSTAATGIGGMELAMGLSEQKADKDADQNMRAYIATMKCTYANGKTVKASPAEVELPGGNDQQLMNYRAEFLSLASDLKERKNALGMKAGIESEEILDKVASGLYDDENVGIESGAFESRYRALMLGSEQDQAMLDEAAEKSSKRVKGGAIAAGAGVLVGVAGNALINGKLGEKIKELRNKKDNGEKLNTEDDKKTIALLKQGLRKSSLKLHEINKVSWKKLDGIGEIKSYVQAINFELIPHDEAYKITSVTKTEEAIALITMWYKTQADNNLITSDLSVKKTLCENTANDDIVGVWNTDQCNCSSRSGKTVEWSDTEGCHYIQDIDSECSESETQSLKHGTTFKKINGICKIETCDNNWTVNTDTNQCECDLSKYKIEKVGNTEICMTKSSVSTAQKVCEMTIGDNEMHGIWNTYTCFCPYKKGFSVVWSVDTCKYTEQKINYSTNDITKQFGSGNNILSNLGF